MKVHRHIGLLALLAAGIGCAAPEAAPPQPSSALPLCDALAQIGRVQCFEGPPDREVVLLKDRHAVGAGIFVVDDELRAFQRDQRVVVGHLVSRGFTLLGCEHTLGPIPMNDAALDHVEAIERARDSRDDVNRWSIFQPLRYQVELGGRLDVVGVEDPVLYAEDLETLGQIEKVAQAGRFPSAGGPSKEALDAEQKRLLRKIRANVDARGSLAARNLLDVMRERGRSQAMLLLGASHIPAAAAELEKAGVRHVVFEASTFQRRSVP